MKIRYCALALSAVLSLAVAPARIHAATVAPAIDSDATKSAAVETGKPPVVEKSTSKPAGNKKPAHLFMWKVSNAKGAVYLVGSIHLVKPDFYPLPEAMEDAFKKSAVLVLEIDESKSDPGAMQQMVLTSGMYGDGDTLQNHLSKETGEAFKKYLASNPQAQSFVMMKPWLAGMMIPMTELQRHGFDPNVGIDKHFMNEAKESGKATDELESADFQLKLISGFSDDLQDKLLLSSLIDVSDCEKDAGEMVQAWKSGDPNAMQTIVSKDENEHPELRPVMEKILYDRNATMEKKIENYIDSGKQYFVVAGAAHLVGKRGLLQLLKDKGYKVEQL